MPTLTGTGTGLAITIDVLMRVSVVLTVGLLLAVTARRNAALRHAILVAGLAAAFIMPAAMLTVQVLPVVPMAARVGSAGSGSTTPPQSPWSVRDRRANRDTTPRAWTTRPPRSVPYGRTRPTGSWADASAQSDESSLGPRALSGLNALRAMDGQRPALGVAVRGDRQGDRARPLVGAPATDRGAGASRRRRSGSVRARADSTTNSDATPAAIVGERGSLRPRRSGRHRQLCAPADGMGRGVCARTKCWRSSATSPRTSRDATIAW